MRIDYANLPVWFSPEERAERARAIFKRGYNCCQSVVLAFDDVIVDDVVVEGENRVVAFDFEVLAMLSAGFGGGMGRMREVCGTVSGMTFMAGIISPAANPSDMAARTANYSLVQKFASAFCEMNGTIICRELLQRASVLPQVFPAEGPVPESRTAEYYGKRPCPELTAIAASIVAEEILSRRLA